MKYPPGQPDYGGSRHHARAREDYDRAHPALGAVCPRCGARVGKPCVSTVPAFGAGGVGTPIEGVHAERFAAAREMGIA